MGGRGQWFKRLREPAPQLKTLLFAAQLKTLLVAAQLKTLLFAADAASDGSQG